MKNLKFKILDLVFVSFILFFSFIEFVHSESEKTVLNFDKIWNYVKRGSPLLAAVQHETEGAEISQNRSARHWYPRLSLWGQVAVTNNPNLNFMSNLGQRQIGSLDFTPANLNQPGTHGFEQGGLRLDFPLYEGGVRDSLSKMARINWVAKRWDEQATKISEYSRLAQLYSELLVLMEERKQLVDLEQSVLSILERYSIGTKANPVGYSGLLGLKTFKNRIEGLLSENNAKYEARKLEISTLAVGIPSGWEPQVLRARDFLKATFPEVSYDVTQEGIIPASVHAWRARAMASDLNRDVENSHFLPRFGLFANEDLYSGSRATSTSFTTGAYLQWELFSATQLGAVSQAAHEAEAVQARADAHFLKMSSEHTSSIAHLQAVERNLALLDESVNLLEEQTQIAKNLFRSGSLNALQLVEVLSRRADLLINRSQVEMSLANLRSSLFLTTAHDGDRL